ncbi:sulfoxide reductase heme-binding subunit YedZ [Faunimonas pinastri]|uniref:Protein-methionine-sulfoxide reductase heme-binding subunit MsrQ n=1 Tax=Faunimonas pinastri TaxID=1855383 RepID=A0A1H9JZ15_9HYPH|nr:protein-methionine-sulfoxide reductase heme-binding subunit MsrQ [Faunimonas pinastri]SEQ92079.1 sulfoxide reductase heme-binding subunit YedZ [Faunimonas pinastri]
MASPARPTAPPAAAPATPIRRSGPRPGRRQAWQVWALYVVGFVPAVWTFYLGATDQLGADPVKSFEHSLGLWALRFLILTLCVTPLREITGMSLIRYRRALGLLAFYYAAMHLSTYLILDQGLDIAAVVADVLKRLFITIGMAAFVMLIPLAVTSNGYFIRRLGRNWGRLHKLIYLAAAAGAVHFVMSVKSWPTEPLVYAGIVAVLLTYRLLRPLWRPKRRGSARQRSAGTPLAGQPRQV